MATGEIMQEQAPLDDLIARIDRDVAALRIQGNKDASEEEGLASRKRAVRRSHDFRCYEGNRR